MENIYNTLWQLYSGQ